jgi:ParB-like chromosome segregation protein Spo0J
VTEATVWKGADALRPFLVPIGSLEPFPGNPRRGDVAAIRASLRRFGQVRPILVDGSRVVAGHHLRIGAQEEEWTHLAAIENRFDSEAEARAFLLADNRTSELGSFEDELLAAQLREVEVFEGTGYTEADRDRLEKELRDLFAEQSEEPPRLDERDPKYSTQPRGFEVTLYLVDRDGRRDFAQHVKLLEREWGVEGTTDVVLRAVREAALAANQA